MRFKVLISALIVFASPQTWAYTVANGRLVEDFTSLDGSDAAHSTGVWNIVNNRAQAGAVADGDPTRPISFGTGADGELDTAGVVNFNTDTKPVYNFTSVNIRAGATINVTGSNPLVIRSLSTVTIVPTLSVSGGLGNPGVTASLTGPSGGIAKACPSVGGDGGTNPTALTFASGGDGTTPTGSEANGGAGAMGAGPAADGSPAASTPLGSDFDAVNGFYCGTGGGGGGSHTDGAALHATGASGGAGGGAVRITAVGDIDVGPITADGGDGGQSLSDTVDCSGHGGGGSGGAVWLQSLNSIITAVLDPTAAAGTGGAGNGCGIGSGGSFAGELRGDSTALGRPAWAAGDFDTDLAASGAQSYTVVSRGYDLDSLNVNFGTPAVTSATAGGGSVGIQYAGSVDNITYSDYVSNIRTLSDQNYRYVKFKVTITTAAGSAVSPEVSRVVIPFQDLGFLNLSGKLAYGCAVLNINAKSRQHFHTSLGFGLFLFWSLVFFSIYRVALWISSKHSATSSPSVSSDVMTTDDV